MLDRHDQLNGPVSVNEEQRKFKNYCETRGIQYALKNMNKKKRYSLQLGEACINVNGHGILLERYHIYKRYLNIKFSYR